MGPDPAGLFVVAARVLVDRPAPERRRVGVLLPLPDLPRTPEAVEGSEGGGPAHAVPPESPEDEELRHVEDPALARDLAPPGDQREPGELLVEPEQEWMSPFVYPVGREIDAPEAPVLVDVHLEHLAEVVVVELREVLEQHLLL